MRALTLTATLLALTACSETQTNDAGAMFEPQQPVRTCESIREDIVRLADERGVIVVKIYEPTPVQTEPKKVSCTGRAVLGTGQEGTIYYRAFEDEEGDCMLQYSEEPLEL